MGQAYADLAEPLQQLERVDRELKTPDPRTEAGRLVPADAARLANALTDLLSSPEERWRMGRAGRVRVEACFTLERQLAEMSAVYRRAAASA